MMFKFANDNDKGQIFYMSPWSTRILPELTSVGLTVVDFTKIQFWAQLHDLGLEKFRTENARRIRDKTREYVKTNKEVSNLSKS